MTHTQLVSSCMKSISFLLQTSKIHRPTHIFFFFFKGSGPPRVLPSSLPRPSSVLGMPFFLGMPARLLRSVESVKMMHRPVAVADAKPIGCRDRRADPGLGLTHRGCHVLALGKTSRDG